MPTKLIKIKNTHNSMIEFSFISESPLDHKGEDFPQNILDVHSLIGIRCLEKAYDTQDSLHFESWNVEFGPLKTPGLAYWSHYEPIAVLSNSSIVVGIGHELIALSKVDGQVLWRLKLGEGWIRTVINSMDHLSLFVLIEPSSQAIQKESLFRVDYTGRLLWKTCGPDSKDRILSLGAVTKEHLTAFNLGFGFHLSPDTGKEIHKWTNK